MTSSKNRPTSAKALLAIAFAGGVLTAPVSALGQESPKAEASVIESIAKNAGYTPEEKAYYLLQLAYCYITGGDATSLETNLKASIGQQSGANRVRGAWRRERAMATWAESLSLLSHTTRGKTQSPAGKKKISDESLALADKAIAAAVGQIGQGSKDTEALNLYLIASCLSRMTGNKQNEQKSTRMLNEAIHACEASKTVNGVQIQEVASILNSMAYGLIPIRIPLFKAEPPEQTTAIDMKNFDESERLKLRAAALLDRLPKTDQERRKTHRDLTLWYSQLGKNDKALKEKQELFKLVGVNDDSILYPQPGSCGHPLWWSVTKVAVYTKCGMG